MIHIWAWYSMEMQERCRKQIFWDLYWVYMRVGRKANNVNLYEENWNFLNNRSISATESNIPRIFIFDWLSRLTVDCTCTCTCIEYAIHNTCVHTAHCTYVHSMMKIQNWINHIPLNCCKSVYPHFSLWILNQIASSLLPVTKNIMHAQHQMETETTDNTKAVAWFIWSSFLLIYVDCTHSLNSPNDDFLLRSFPSLARNELLFSKSMMTVNPSTCSDGPNLFIFMVTTQCQLLAMHNFIVHHFCYIIPVQKSVVLR